MNEEISHLVPPEVLQPAPKQRVKTKLLTITTAILCSWLLFMPLLVSMSFSTFDSFLVFWVYLAGVIATPIVIIIHAAIALVVVRHARQEHRDFFLANCILLGTVLMLVALSILSVYSLEGLGGGIALLLIMILGLIPVCLLMLVSIVFSIKLIRQQKG